MEALGRLFNIGAGFAPGDLQGGRTGLRVSMQHADAATIVVFKGAGTAGDDPAFVLKQHTAETSGTTANLAVIDHYYLKAEATLDADEVWLKVTQAASATISDPGALTTSAEEQQILVIEISASQLADGYTHISLDATDPANANAQQGACLIFTHGLRSMRSPELLPDTKTGF